MSKSSYDIQSGNLISIVDTAIEALHMFPPLIFDEVQLTHFVGVYISFRNKIMYMPPLYKNLKSLKFIQADIFIYFQEGSGQAINYFWSQVKDKGLPYQRENKLVKILKRKKMKNQNEYDYVTDVLVVFQQEGLIDDNDVLILNDAISRYEGRKM